MLAERKAAFPTAAHKPDLENDRFVKIQRGVAYYQDSVPPSSALQVQEVEDLELGNTRLFKGEFLSCL